MADKTLSFEIDPAAASGSYSNFVIIAHSAAEVILDFASMLPGMSKPRVTNRIVLTPEHAKRLLHSLHENLTNYENHYGTINLHTGGFKSSGEA